MNVGHKKDTNSGPQILAEQHTIGRSWRELAMTIMGALKFEVIVLRPHVVDDPRVI